MGPVTLYGIANCDSVKKARAQLAAAGVQVSFHDFKKLGLAPQRIDAWLAALDWQLLLNRRGSTWRALDAASQAAVVDADAARALMLAQTSLVKRPVIEWPDGALSVGLEDLAQRLGEGQRRQSAA